MMVMDGKSHGDDGDIDGIESQNDFTRFSPKMIAKTLAGRFSDSVTISNIGILKAHFSGATLGSTTRFH